MFIDWVSIYQQHQGADIVGKNLYLWVDRASGDVISEGVGYLSHEGSHSSAVRVRSYNGCVEWSGNPSRFNRPDNVFGYTSMRDCLRIINSHMVELGLPEFTADPLNPSLRRLQSELPEAPSAALSHDGAVLTRVDLCRNFATGSADNLRTYTRAASCATYRGKGPSTLYEGSVAWGSARNTRLKIYDKGSELRSHTKKSFDPAIAEYRSALADWCDSVGLVRQEMTLGRQQLRSKGLRSLLEWDDKTAFGLLVERFDKMSIGCSQSLTGGVLSKFVDAGFSERQSATLSGIVSRWYMGEDVSAGVSRATFYRYRSNIRSVFGIDVTSPPDVAVLNTQVRQISLEPVSPPSWYQVAA